MHQKISIVICLEAILNYAINKDNTFTRRDENKWTTAALIINLQNTIDIKEIEAIFNLPSCVAAGI